MAGAGNVRSVTPAHRTPRIDLTGPCLLLGAEPVPGVDVVLVDLDGVGADQVADLVARAEADHQGGIGVRGGRPSAVGSALAARVGLVVLDVGTTDPAEVRAVVESGVVVVLHHGDPAVAVGAVDQLNSTGVDTSRVVVEVGPDDRLVEEVTVLERSAFGFRVGAVMALPDGARGWTESARAGWEIGTLTALLAAGVASVRGADPERFRRVAAVLHHIDRAGADVEPVGRSAAPSRNGLGPVAP